MSGNKQNRIAINITSGYYRHFTPGCDPLLNYPCVHISPHKLAKSSYVMLKCGQDISGYNKNGIAISIISGC